MNIDTILKWLNANSKIIIISILTFIMGILTTYLKQHTTNKGV